jgi:NADH-ubiquinone oxidoreductase chain 2
MQIVRIILVKVKIMIIITILTLIVAIALPTTKISPLQFARLSAISFLFSAFLSFNAFDIESLGTGIGIYSGLYQVSPITQSIETFIYLIASFILVPWFIQPVARKENSRLLAYGSVGAYGQDPSLNTGPILSEYSLILLFSVLGATLLISSADLISMYLSIELQSFAVYILAAIHRDSESATAAGLKYFLLGGLSSCFILLGAALIYSYTGLTNLESIFNIMLSTDNTSYSIIPVLGLLFIVLGFLFKIAAAPLHNWAPDVYDEVPTIVTTWLTIMPKISIIIFLLELVNSSLLGSVITSTDIISTSIWSLPLKNILLVSSLLSLIIGSVVGLAQYKIKRLLAYSTISHIGFLLLALGINTEQSTESLIFYLLQYSVTNLNTFLILLAFGYITTQKRLSNGYLNISSSTIGVSTLDIRYISELKAQFIKNPLLSLSLAFCLFSMAGIPPLLGFFAKQQILYAATYSGYYFMSIVAILVSVISASYYLQIIKVMHFTTTTKPTINSGSVPEAEADTPDVKINISASHSMLISVFTLSIVLFMLNPNILLNSTHLLALTIFQT